MAVVKANTSLKNQKPDVLTPLLGLLLWEQTLAVPVFSFTLFSVYLSSMFPLK